MDRRPPRSRKEGRIARRGPRRAGFTLIELLIVVVIIGIPTALTFTTSTGISIGGGGSAQGYFLSAKHVSSPST